MIQYQSFWFFQRKLETLIPPLFALILLTQTAKRMYVLSFTVHFLLINSVVFNARVTIIGIFKITACTYFTRPNHSVLAKYVAGMTSKFHYSI